MHISYRIFYLLNPSPSQLAPPLPPPRPWPKHHSFFSQPALPTLNKAVDAKCSPTGDVKIVLNSPVYK